jgi:superfamily II DNA or RNA helicase
MSQPSLNIVDVTYAQTKASINTDALGMREMQARAYAQREARYLLLKAPPASGKSRALMFLGLHKLRKQGLKKVIVAVPERSIGSSFAPTNLSKYGFAYDWDPDTRYNLCTPGADDGKGKVDAFHRFLKDGTAEILICTHATLRFAGDGLEATAFNGCLLAIDEFHHVSASAENRLGELLRRILNGSDAHVIAMTGSYFRGDAVPILEPEDEARFTRVTYNYYEQLNGYEYLKSLGIGYHFYQGPYTSAIGEVLDTDKKTILHIPSPNAGESTKDKYNEVGFIIDSIGVTEKQDFDTGLIHVRRPDGKIIKVADLVNDDPKERERIVETLRNIKDVDGVDLIIALGMAKEGFDWPWCEHALTVGYRGSLTEIIQIIGRATRDSDNKTHAQFTNLISQPLATDEEVTVSVNNLLKAITASLLMEQVMAPNWNFRTRREGDDAPAKRGEMKIKGLKEPSSKRVKDIVADDLNDLKADILQDAAVRKAIPGQLDPEVMNKVMIPKVIRLKFPDLNDEEVEELRQHVVVDAVVKNGEMKTEGGKQFVRMAGKFVNIDELHIDLIDQVNPFQRAFEVLSKSVTTKTLKAIQDVIAGTRITMDFEEAKILWPKIKAFRREHGREPRLNAPDLQEHRMAECIIYLKEEKKKRNAAK